MFHQRVKSSEIAREIADALRDNPAIVITYFGAESMIDEVFLELYHAGVETLLKKDVECLFISEKQKFFSFGLHSFDRSVGGDFIIHDTNAMDPSVEQVIRNAMRMGTKCYRLHRDAGAPSEHQGFKNVFVYDL